MSKFFVGQRVRVKASDNKFLAHLVGAELVITRDGPHDDGTPCWWVNAKSIRDLEAGVQKHHAGNYLEPITPSGAQPSEFTTLHDLLESLEGVAA